MAQELGKVNVSKTEKNEIFCKKLVVFSKVQLLAKSSFLKKKLSHNKNQPQTLAQQVLTQQIPLIFCCYTTSPRAAGRTKCGTATPEKEIKFLKEGARGDRGSADQNESPSMELSFFKGLRDSFTCSEEDVFCVL